MTAELRGKVALVTGGSRGIGAAIATALAGRGADVAITYARSAERARSVAGAIEAGGRRCLIIRADSGDSDAIVGAVDETVARLGRIDILVNNAGVFPFGPPEAVTVEEADRTLALHVRAPFLAACAAIRHMPDGGRIISIGSSLARRVPQAGVALYAMSKSALIGMTKGLARDLGPRGITVNVVDPGSTDTEMNPADGGAADGERALTALGRYGRPEDVAAAVVFLAGESASYITGASIAVDGGASA